MKKKIGFWIWLSWLVATPLWAGAAGDAPIDDPAKMVSNGIERLLVFLRQPGNRNPAAMERYVQREIAPAFDFDYMSRWVAGPAARRMTPEQRQRFKAVFSERFLKMVVGQLVKFAVAGRIQVLPSRRVRGNQATVSVLLGERRGYPARVDFRMYRSPAGWRVFDVAANGSSLLAYFRRQFASGTPPRRAWR